MRLSMEDVKRHKENKYEVMCRRGTVRMSDGNIIGNLCDTIEAQHDEIEQLQAQVAAMREALEMAKEDIEEWHTSYSQDSAGGFKVIPCDGCYTCDDVLPKISEALSSDAGKAF